MDGIYVTSFSPAETQELEQRIAQLSKDISGLYDRVIAQEEHNRGYTDLGPDD